MVFNPILKLLLILEYVIAIIKFNILFHLRIKIDKYVKINKVKFELLI